VFNPRPIVWFCDSPVEIAAASSQTILTPAWKPERRGAGRFKNCFN